MKKILLIFVVVVLSFSCERMAVEKEITRENGPVFKAMIDNPTKTILTDGIKTEWIAADAISVFGARANSYYFQTDAGGATGSFYAGTGDWDAVQADATFSTTNHYALYPYNYSATLSSSTVTTYLNPTQYLVDGDFPSNQKPILIGISETDQVLNFQHAAALVKFTLVDNNITWLYFHGGESDDVVGNYTINYDGSAVTANGDAHEVTLKKDNEGNPLEAGTYYFVIAPHTFSNGFTISWGPDVTGVTQYKSIGSSVTAQAGHILNMGTLLNSVDEENPAITDFSEYDFGMKAGVSHDFTVSASDNKALKSITVVIYNSLYAEIARVKKTASGTSCTCAFSIKLDSAGSYTLSAFATDAAGNITDPWWNTSITVTE